MSSYSVTAYLPGPRNTYSQYSVKDRSYTPEGSTKLDYCLRRAGRQNKKLDSLNRQCEESLDTCNMWYKTAHRREIELGDALYDTRLLVASLPDLKPTKRSNSMTSRYNSNTSKYLPSYRK